MVVLVARWWWDAQTYIHIYSPCHVMMMIVKAKIDCIDGWLNECCIKKRVVFCCFSHGQYLIQSLLHVIVLQQPQKKRKKLFHFPSWSSFFLFFYQSTLVEQEEEISSNLTYYFLSQCCSLSRSLIRFYSFRLLVSTFTRVILRVGVYIS